MVPPPVPEATPSSAPVFQNQPSDQLPVRLGAIVAAASLKERIQALHQLPTTLSSNELTALSAWLTNDFSPSLPRPATLAFKNEIMTVLRSRHSALPELPEILMAVFRNQQLDVVLRDYSLQHLAAFYEEVLLPEEPSPASLQTRQNILSVLTEALDETGSSIVGTALLSLHRLSALESSLDKEMIGRKAGELLTNPGVGELTRITALQICAETGNKVPLPAITDLATKGASVPVRLSALAALASLGDRSQRETLLAVSLEPDARLQLAARAALSKLDRRIFTSTAAPSI
jgi:hypothetical protein